MEFLEKLLARIICKKKIFENKTDHYGLTKSIFENFSEDSRAGSKTPDLFEEIFLRTIKRWIGLINTSESTGLTTEALRYTFFLGTNAKTV